MLYMEPEIPNPDQTPTPEPPNVNTPATPAVNTKFQPVASYRHTALFLGLLILFAFLSAKLFAMKQPSDVNDAAFHISKYLPTLIWQWLMFAIAYAGLKQKGVRLKQIIGGW